MSMYPGWEGEEETANMEGGRVHADRMFVVSLQGRAIHPGERVDSLYGPP